MSEIDDEERQMRSVALQTANTIMQARQRAEAELLRTREALRESQERLQAALSAAGTGTFRWDLPSGIVTWDGDVARIFGFGHGDATQRIEAFLDAAHPDDRPGVVAAAEQAVRQGGDFDMEFRVVWPDGSIHWIAGKARTFRNEDAVAQYVTGACADITSRRQAEAVHRERADLLKAMFHQAAVGMAIAGLDGGFIEVNRRFADILGYSPDELLSKSSLEITHDDDRAETEALVSRLLAGSIAEYAVEKRYMCRDGGLVWTLTTVTLLRDLAGQPQQMIDVIEDITARKKAEAALQEETRALELLNETGRTVASNLELQSLVQAVTDAATSLSGAQFGAFFYNTINEDGEAFLLFTLSGAPREAFEKFGQPRATALFGPTFRGEAPIRCDDVLADPRYGTMSPHHGMPKGHPPVRSFLAVPVTSRSGEGIGGLFFGHPETGVFTERIERLLVGVAAQAGIAIDNARLYEAAQRAAEERRALLESERAARSAAEKMSEVKDDFLATLSHELRTPLNAILGWARLLQGGEKTAADYAKGLETIERNARVQAQLIEDLLDMSRITSGKLRLDVQPLQPMALIETAIESVLPAADAKGIRIERCLDPGAGPISGDPGRLQQVVWNLLSNAIKFTGKGGKVQIVLERVNSHIEFSVADTGSGIRPEFIPHLFERFRQSDATTTRMHGGLGLGLSIVKSLVELHGGTVCATSPGEGLGTTVTVHLPLAVVHRAATRGDRLHPKTAQAGTHQVGAELTGLRVLVVDDQADARELIKRVLEDCEAIVMTASSAAEALQMVEQDRPDVLVSDIGMPETDGFQLLRQVRLLGPDRGGMVPAIALTAFARSEDRTRTLRAGFRVHVAKPVDPSELVATVASVAGRV